MKAKVFTLSIVCCLFGQSEGVAPKKDPNPVQVTVSGNHPDACLLYTSDAADE